jgi:hypothetical protein
LAWKAIADLAEKRDLLYMLTPSETQYLLKAGKSIFLLEFFDKELSAYRGFAAPVRDVDPNLYNPWPPCDDCDLQTFNIFLWCSHCWRKLCPRCALSDMHRNGTKEPHLRQTYEQLTELFDRAVSNAEEYWSHYSPREISNGKSL